MLAVSFASNMFSLHSSSLLISIGISKLKMCTVASRQWSMQLYWCHRVHYRSYRWLLGLGRDKRARDHPNQVHHISGGTSLDLWPSTEWPLLSSRVCAARSVINLMYTVDPCVRNHTDIQTWQLEVGLKKGKEKWAKARRGEGERWAEEREGEDFFSLETEDFHQTLRNSFSKTLSLHNTLWVKAIT